jgi:hypothetical protein
MSDNKKAGWKTQGDSILTFGDDIHQNHTM